MLICNLKVAIVVIKSISYLRYNESTEGVSFLISPDVIEAIVKKAKKKKKKRIVRTAKSHTSLSQSDPLDL